MKLKNKQMQTESRLSKKLHKEALQVCQFSMIFQFVDETCSGLKQLFTELAWNNNLLQEILLVLLMIYVLHN